MNLRYIAKLINQYCDHQESLNKKRDNRRLSKIDRSIKIYYEDLDHDS